MKDVEKDFKFVIFFVNEKTFDLKRETCLSPVNMLIWIEFHNYLIKL